MDERTFSTFPALKNGKETDKTSNLLAALVLWSALLLLEALIGLFGSYAWVWVGVGVLALLISGTAIAANSYLYQRYISKNNPFNFALQKASMPKDGRVLQPRTLLTLRAIHKSYESASGEVATVLKGVDLSIEAGSFNVIRGESGSGKTSLLRIIGMLDSNFDGDYVFVHDDIKEKPDWYRDELRANNIGFIFQDGQLFSHMGIRENITLPIRLQGTADQRREAQKRIALLAPNFFTNKELADEILSSSPKKVSGGQKQRAAIMRSVVNEPAIILADEPTASLDESRKQEILELLLSLCKAGHTVIVVSHDKVFYRTGRQLELSHGILQEIASDGEKSGRQLAFRRPPSGTTILFGWRPRAPLGILIAQAMRETFLRPIFLFLVLISLCVGVCQIGVFSSLLVGTQAFLDEAMTRGSRLNRLEIKPRTVDLDTPNRFPVISDIDSWKGVQAIVPRRAALARIYGADGDKNVYSAMGLQTNDPEYRLLNFVAGGPFNPSNEELEVIITAGLLPDLFKDASSLAEGTKRYSDFIGKPVTVEVPQFARNGQELKARARKVQLKIAGIILYAEGGRQLYLPNRTLLVFDRYKMDRDGVISMPVTEAGDDWTDDRALIANLTAFPWEDQLHIYTKQIRDIIPIFQQLSQLGYKPASDIWNYKWVLDVRDLAWNIFIPLLTLIIFAVGLTVATNIFSSAKLRETEFALWRILGMRRGDLVITQVISTIVMVLFGTALGLAIGYLLVDGARSFLADTSPGAGLEKVFAPVSQFFLAIVTGATVVGIASAIYPAVRTAHADPAKVLQS